MKVIDINKFIENMKIEEILAKSFSKKFNKDEEQLRMYFNGIVQKQINNIAETLINSKDDPEELSRLQGLSLDEFMKDNDKIIKDK